MIIKYIIIYSQIYGFIMKVSFQQYLGMKQPFRVDFWIVKKVNNRIEHENNTHFVFDCVLIHYFCVGLVNFTENKINMIQENFIRLFEDSFRKNWDLPGFSNYGEETTLTYADIAKRVARLHILFDQCHIQQNDKIALIGRNNANWAVTYLATVTYGAIIVPVLQDFNPNDVHHITNHSESKLLFTGDNIWENLEEEKLTTVKAVFSLTGFNCITLLNKEPKPETEENQVYEQLVVKYLQPDYINSLFHAKYPHGFHRDHVRYVDKPNNEIVSINYTSGTTGFSKGVMTSGNALAGNITFGLRTKLLGPGYRIVSFLPLAHAYGCAFDFLTPVCAGSHIYFIGKHPRLKYF